MLSEHGMMSPSEIANRLRDEATPNVITGVVNDMPSSLLYTTGLANQQTPQAKERNDF